MDINKFSTLLKSKFGLEVADMTQPSPAQIRILARLPPTRMGDWLAGMHHVLTSATGSKAWTVDFSKSYFLRNERIVYAWRIIVQSKNPKEPITGFGQDILNTFAGSPKSSRGEVMEIGLMGSSMHRNGRTSSGKGASTIEGSDNFAPTRLR